MKMTGLPRNSRTAGCGGRARHAGSSTLARAPQGVDALDRLAPYLLVFVHEGGRLRVLQNVGDLADA